MLEQIFLNQQLGPLGLTNFLKHAIFWGVNQGYSLESLVLILLLPLTLTFLALARYLIGIQGLNLFAPIIMSVIFLSTGITSGLLLFLSILLIEILMTLLLRHLRVHFVAKMALVLLLSCLTLFCLLILPLTAKNAFLFNSSLIPLLILILIAENLAELQLRKTPSKALRALLETLVLALLSFAVLSSSVLRRIVLLYPEATLILTLALNIWIGKFTGLRLLEYYRFKRLLKK